MGQHAKPSNTHLVGSNFNGPKPISSGSPINCPSIDAIGMNLSANIGKDAGAQTVLRWLSIAPDASKAHL
jgi:hypothetical protein